MCSTGDISALHSELQNHIDSLSALPLHDTIQSLTNLLPDLSTSISSTGVRLVTHQNYNGVGKLDDLGRLYLRAADRCTREHASFKTRLLHVTLDDMMLNLYVSSNDQRRAGLNDGTVVLPPPTEEDRGCACCRGDPDAVILAGFVDGNALYYWEDEYKSIWGEEESIGSRYGGGESWLMASKEQVERVMSREAANVSASSRL